MIHTPHAEPRRRPMRNQISYQPISSVRFIPSSANKLRMAACILLAAACSQEVASDATAPIQSSQPASSVFRLHIVGAGVPPPSRTRHGSAFLLQVDREHLMIDCGPATTYKMARMGIGPKAVNHVFLTHHHFDHNADFPCFALARWDLCNGREPPLAIYGPPPTQSFVERLIGQDGVFYPDWHSRVQEPVSVKLFKKRGGVPPRPAPAFVAQDVNPGKIVQTDAWTVTAARVHHVEPTLISMAYRFETRRGSIVFAGDCGDCPELRRLAQDADTLVIACVCFGKAEKYNNIITGIEDVGAIAREAGVHRVVLTHIPPGMASESNKRRAIQEVKKLCKAEVLLPEEMTTIDLTCSKP